VNEQGLTQTRRVLASERTSGLLWAKRHWETGLLSLVGLAMVVMLGYLLWPAPQAVLTIKPLSPNQSYSLDSRLLAGHFPNEQMTNENTSNTTVEASPQAMVDGAVSPISKKVHHARFPHHLKKPKHPPILNLNTASLSQLQLLHGIGPKMAQRIVDYRHSHGPFTSSEQIMDVKGIGPKKFEKIKPYLKI
jgi:comEA protein